MAPRYRVTLTTQERKELEVLTRNGKTPAKKKYPCTGVIALQRFPGRSCLESCRSAWSNQPDH